MDRPIADAERGLFVPSGARVPLLGLPEQTPLPITFPNGRTGKLHRQHVLTPEQLDPALAGGSSWAGGGLRVLMTLDVTEAWGPLLHVSISNQQSGRFPSWSDIAAVKDAVFGDVDAAMILPKREDYVNIGEVAHLWQIPQRWGIR